MILNEIRANIRFLRRLPKFLRDPITYEDAVSTIKQRIDARKRSFLRLVEKTIFENPGSPYLQLLKLADVGFGDIQSMLGQRGLEATLEELDRAGVYVRFEEFKGREPMVRHGREIQTRPSDFDNPLLKAFWRSRTSGSTGAPSNINKDLALIADIGPSFLLTFTAFDVQHVPSTLWRAPSGPLEPIWHAKVGRTVDRWFSPVSSRELRTSTMTRAARRAVAGASRFAGFPIPRVEYLAPDRAEILARWVAQGVSSRGRAAVQTSPSLAVRAGSAAKKAGIDLSGVVFFAIGEPMTEAKREEIESAGARAASVYGIAETGIVGRPCAQPTSSNDNHLVSDLLALITHPRKIPVSGTSVNAFVLTSLLMSTPKILLNVETDDYGLVETRSCGCLLDEVGYSTHLGEIFSFSKLTSEGVTLVGSELLRVLEEELPARFGGSPLDYQLIEEEEEDGLTKVSIIVNPDIPIVDEQEVVDAVLEALRPLKRGSDRAMFREGATLRVRRMNPITTERGNKLMPLHSLRSPGR